MKVVAEVGDVMPLQTYAVWDQDDDGERDGRRIDAFSSKDAAEKWAARKDSDSADYDIVAGRNTPTLCVLAPDGSMTRWAVSGESVSRYSATEELWWAT